MTFNELAAVFNSDDLNPNVELIFHVDSQVSMFTSDFDYVIEDFVIDDVASNDNYVSIYLRGK